MSVIGGELLGKKPKHMRTAQNPELLATCTVQKGAQELIHLENAHAVVSEELLRKIKSDDYNRVYINSFYLKWDAVKTALYSIDDDALSSYRQRNPLYTERIRNNEYILLSRNHRCDASAVPGDSVQIFGYFQSPVEY